MTIARRVTACTAAALTCLLVASCSGGSEATSASPTGFSLPPLESAMPSDTAMDTAIDAQNACEDYYSFNLQWLELPTLGKADQRDAIDGLVQVASDLAGSTSDAVTAQELPDKVVPNAERIAKTLARLPAKARYKDLNKKQIRRVNASAVRIEKACVRNGFDVPDDNLAARE